MKNIGEMKKLSTQKEEGNSFVLAWKIFEHPIQIDWYRICAE
jgi:hypothetical protein